MVKMSDKAIVLAALIWAEESMWAMVHGSAESDPNRADVLSQVNQLRAYRLKHYGKRPNPLKGAKLVTLDELRKQ
jgi:hypothetical protein